MNVVFYKVTLLRIERHYNFTIFGGTRTLHIVIHYCMVLRGKIINNPSYRVIYKAMAHVDPIICFCVIWDWELNTCPKCPVIFTRSRSSYHTNATFPSCFQVGTYFLLTQISKDLKVILGNNSTCQSFCEQQDLDRCWISTLDIAETSNNVYL